MASSGWLPADWPAPPGVRAGTTTRDGTPGVSPPPFGPFNLGLRSGDDPALAARNRVNLTTLLALPSPPHWLRQVHGQRVVRFDAAALDDPTGAREPEADAAVTSVPGVVLAILSADCLPVVLAARDGGEIGAAHCSWRTLSGGLLEATVGALRTPASALVAWIGPAAGPERYEVGEDVFAAFTASDAGAAAAFVPTRPGHWMVDLFALARRRLAALGVTAVHGGGLCTISDAVRFHSYRRDGAASGRLATLVWAEAAPDNGSHG